MADTKNKKPEKFLFDSNSFDVPKEDENQEPEAPVFSEEELAQAQRTSFEQGRAQGLKEAEESREKHVSTLIESITLDLKSLFSTEDEREKRFEHEVAHLCKTIFEKAFPAINKDQGLNEVISILQDILSAQQDQPTILIEVNNDFVSDIENAVQTIQKEFYGSGTIEIIGKEELSDGDCRLSWKDGGASRDAQALYEQIINSLQQGVADNDRMDDNDNNSNAVSEPVEKTVEAEKPAEENQDQVVQQDAEAVKTEKNLEPGPEPDKGNGEPQ